MPALDRNLWKKIIVGLILGLVAGYALSPVGLGIIATVEEATTIGAWFALPGVIFLGLITMVILPLVVSSIILGVCGSGDAGFVKRLSARVLPYFILTSIGAVFIGVAAVAIFNPGSGENVAGLLAEAPAEVRTMGKLTVPERISNLIPTNFIKAALERDLLQVVIASILAGMAVLALPREVTKPVVDLCESALALTLVIIGWAMKLAPLAVFGLTADVMMRMGPGAFVGLGGYVVTVIAGLAGVMVMYLLIVTFIGRRNPLQFLRDIREAQLIAFSTSSSSATMPVTIRVAEDNMNANPDVVRFVVPLGTAVNMDGTALYQVVAALFLCHLAGVDLTMGETLLLAVTMIGASIGTPSTPGVGIVILATIVTGMGVPAAGIGLILGVDRILDMMRTTINVTGDLVAVSVMERFMHPDDLKQHAAPA